MADQRIQYTDSMVGANHPTEADTLNKLTLVSHEDDGTHKFITDATDSSSVSTGALVTAGGVGIGKKLYVGGNTSVAGDLSVIGAFGTNGVKFPATQVPSSDVNTLDDYEEGTFTPALRGSSTAGTLTYGTQTGVYTKIGDFVCLRGEVSVSTVSVQPNGLLQITGFPFTPSANSSFGSVILDTVTHTSGTKDISGVQLYISASNPYIRMTCSDGTVANASAGVITSGSTVTFEATFSV